MHPLKNNKLFILQDIKMDKLLSEKKENIAKKLLIIKLKFLLLKIVNRG